MFNTQHLDYVVIVAPYAFLTMITKATDKGGYDLHEGTYVQVRQPKLVTSPSYF